MSLNEAARQTRLLL